MHEVSIATALVSQVCAAAAREGAKRIVSISIELGKLSGVMRDPLEFAFPLVAEGTLAAGAKLLIREIPIRTRCPACAAETDCEQFDVVCQQCNAVGLEVLGGRDFLVSSMEVL